MEDNKPTQSDTRSVDPEALEQMINQMVGDLGACVDSALVKLGDHLRIYGALGKSGPATSERLADITGLDERNLREWLSAKSASGYVTYEPKTETFSLTPEQAAAFAELTARLQ